MGQCQATTAKGDQCQNSAQEGSDYCHITSHSAEEQKEDLTPKQERFCQLFVSEEFFGNGTQAYSEAYDVDLSESYRTAQVNASKLLSNTIICDRINELLDEAGLNDNFVDKQMLFMITQNADYAQKMAAIREYNKVKGRITNKHDIKSGGEQVKGLTFNIVNGSDDN